MARPTTPEFDVACRAARAGAAILVATFRTGLTMRTKRSGVDLVSEADTRSEQAIAAVIRAAFPDHAILGEELHDADLATPHLWVVDPLDGTTNFAHGIDHFAVSIAYYRDGVAQAGVVHVPLRDQWYGAIRGAGAFAGDAAMRVSAATRLDEELVGVGFYYDRGAMMEATLAAIRDVFGRGVHGIRRFGTASLDLCQVALGRYGAYFEYELAPWDFAAGRLIVEEAGGRVTTCTGSPLPLARSTLLASNDRLHEAMLEIVSRHRPR